MVAPTVSRAIPTRPRAVTALTLLLGTFFFGLGLGFPFYAFARQESLALRLFAVVLVAMVIATVTGVWQQRPWALWAVLVLLSGKLTVDIFTWSLALDRSPLLWLGEAINIGVVTLTFLLARRGPATVTRAQRIFYGFVLALAAWVAFWGLAIPRLVDTALPFMVPPLHARFLGAMYLSGAVFLALGIAAKSWSEVRVMTPMIAIWTGTLGLVSLLHLDQFDWTRGQSWVWFLAYSAYPLIAAWISWRQRGSAAPLLGLPLARALRGYLIVQGGLITALALGLLVAAPLMVRGWPWPIPVVLAHLYAAPFLSFGLGSLYAARQHGWAEARIVVYGTLVFALGVLLASLNHRELFAFDRPVVWLWFGGFALASLSLALFGAIPALRNAPPAGWRTGPVSEQSHV